MKWFIVVSSVVFLALGLVIGFTVRTNSIQFFPNSSPTPDTTPTPTLVRLSESKTKNWKEYTIRLSTATESYSLKLPPQITELGRLVETINRGEIGYQICHTMEAKQSVFIKSVHAGGGACDSEPFSIGLLSADFVAGRETGFTDSKGYKKSDGQQYQYRGMTNGYYDILGKTKEITNEQGVSVLIVIGENGDDEYGFPVQGTPGKGRIGALINTNDSEYPGIALFMSLTDELTESLFTQIVSTIKSK